MNDLFAASERAVSLFAFDSHRWWRLVGLGVFWFVLVTMPISGVNAEEHVDLDDPGQAVDLTGIGPAEAVMHEFMRAFNARDMNALADTLAFPHVRIASGNIYSYPTREAFVEAMDMSAFAERFDWSRSEWDFLDVVQADATKVHFKVAFSRFNPAGEKNATFDSLYVVQLVDDRWGIRARSSFAP